MAEIVANASTASLAFKDAPAAAEVLRALRGKSFVRGAFLTAGNGSVFARFGEIEDGAQLAIYPLPGQFRSVAGDLLYTRQVVLEKKAIGMLYMRCDYRRVFSELLGFYARVLLGVALGSIGLAVVLADRLHRVITDPVLTLARAAQGVAAKQDYAVRVPAVHRDELGYLARAFNQMLARIEAQDAALKESERRYRLLFEENPLPMWVYDVETLGFLAVNRASLAKYGYSQ
jgi:methyl-accepting chemotaxis protein